MSQHVESVSNVAGKAADAERPATRLRSLWILGPWTDLLLIVGSPLLIFLGITAARQQWDAAAISSFVMIWAIGHHLPGMMRAYGDPWLFERFRARFILAPLFLLAVCSFAFVTTVNSGVIAVAAIWGWWHYLMQAYGFVRIYDSKVGSLAAPTRWLDQAMCLSWFAAAVILNDNALYNFVENFYNSGLPIPSAEFFPRLRSVTLGVTAGVTALFVLNLLLRLRAGERPNPVKLLLMVTTFACFWFSAATVTNIVVAYAFFELFHDAQYLTIVWAFNRNRAVKDSTLRGFTRFLFQPRVALIALYVLLVFGYGSLKYGSTFVTQHRAQQVLMAVFLASTLLHYYFDGFIWKLRDATTLSSLEIDRQEARWQFWHWPMWLRHGLIWSLFVIPFGYLTVSQVQDAMARSREPQDQQLRQRIGEYQELVQCAPGSVRAHYTLGLALEGAGELAQAADEYRRALAIYPDYLLAQQGLNRSLAGGVRPAPAGR